MAPKPVVAFAAALVLGVGLSACTPMVAYNGFQAREEKPQDVQVGVDTKSTVLTRLGSPSAVSTFEPNIWFYVSQVTSKVAYKNPKLRSRDVVAIKFSDDEKVEEVNAYDAEDGFRIAYAKGETPTRGRQITVLEQLLGNVGRGGMLPQEEVAPGQRPGQ
jgi:outer membrane protein assembly factor BamE (lipoprotein component of BamABCDE complex)